MPDERYNDAALPSIQVDLRTLASSLGAADRADQRAIFDEVLSQITESPQLRETRATWSLHSSMLAVQGDLPTTQLSRALERLWDGLRRLPLHNRQLAKAVENCIVFWTFSRTFSDGGLAIDDRAMDEILGPHRLVELGGAGGGTKACVSCDKLIAALRSDMADFIVEPFRDQFLADPSVIVEWAWKVEYLYEFWKLADTVAIEMAPYQVLFRPQDPAFFSPARIERIGS
jgi:hypothetical protein